MDASTAWWLIQALNLIVLVITAGIIYWYTKETYRLRKESERQTELMLRPFVIAKFYLTKHSLAPWAFKVQNIGNSAALNIRVTSPIGFWTIEIPFLANGDSCTYGVITFTESRPSGLSPDGTLMINIGIEHIPQSLKIEFENADRQKYLVSEDVTLRQVKITESSKL